MDRADERQACAARRKCVTRVAAWGGPREATRKSCTCAFLDKVGAILEPFRKPDDS